jgi:hypothetical protein
MGKRIPNNLYGSIWDLFGMDHVDPNDIGSLMSLRGSTDKVKGE